MRHCDQVALEGHVVGNITVSPFGLVVADGNGAVFVPRALGPRKEAALATGAAMPVDQRSLAK